MFHAGSVVAILKNNKKTENIILDLEQIKTGIDKIFDKNHLTHAKNLQYMLEKRSDIGVISNNIFVKKTRLRNIIHEHQNLLSRVLQSEKVIYAKLSELQEKRFIMNKMPTS